MRSRNTIKNISEMSKTNGNKTTPRIKEYSKNPRKITPTQLDKLRRNIEELGDLSGIVHDLNTGEIISGNQRSRVVDINKCEIVITEEYPEPTAQGTVAWGHVLWEGQRLNYRAVRWSSAQRKKANVTANSLGGEWDWDILTTEFDIDLLGDWQLPVDDYLTQQGDSSSSHATAAATNTPVTEDAEAEARYTKKIESPLYEPSNNEPGVEELFDSTRYEELISDIEGASDLPEQVREFLRHAAARHIRFNYKLIADYYSHAPKAVQQLMEDSALVIIDFKKAIELGYVKLSNDIREQYLKEWGDDAE